MRLLYSSVKWKTLSTSYSKLQSYGVWGRTYTIVHVDQRLGIMGENLKLAGLHIGKNLIFRVFFFFNKISINGFKELLSRAPTF